MPTSAGLQGAVCVLTSLPTEMPIPLTMPSLLLCVGVMCVWCVSVCGVNVYVFVSVWVCLVYGYECAVCVWCVTLMDVSVLYVCDWVCLFVSVCFV